MIEKYFCVLWGVFIFILLSTHFAIALSFRVAVAEFYPDMMPNPNAQYTRAQAQAVLLHNVLGFEPLLQQARAANASLVLFPEDALYGAGLKR
jgi:hypothetical protein